MADFQITGLIEGVRFTDTSAIVNVSEYRMGYKKSDGSRVDESYSTWHIFFKPYFKKYISSHFSSGMLVTIKGEVMPYMKHDDEYVDGYTVIGQTMNLASYPKNLRKEVRMRKESQMHATGVPDVHTYNEEDF